MKVYRVTVPDKNEKTGKTHWREVGVIFADDDASGISGATLKLYHNPGVLHKVYPQEKRDKPSEKSKQTSPEGVVDEDSIPF
jgi:hypothetical protein